ncbi:MAG: hydroxymethylglutaryl-CoA lyase [Betaproteobacteria bacterium]|jgi:hydroxymethylglutaryl-CoA lyase|nr:hydroxymethylglutaryl-CoA lyase [Betaproteobacteria bacterium]NBT69156.1 hydroxymethylglutaryl-CoA lyase [Betaproteobacteria bacterium]NBY09340.1 hydroxymethylglutaryl-CoA lyase [Betaproteobacteria bacterium]
MTLPKSITIHELGPREGMQIEKEPIATSEKIRLIDMLSECHFHEIEVTSFVSPKWVPQMADAEDVVNGFKRHEGTLYTCVYLNTQGLQRAVMTKKLDVEGSLSVTASEAFSLKNTNRKIDQTFEETEKRIESFQRFNVKASEVSVMAAFGCNYQGDIAPDHVVSLVSRLMSMAADHDIDIRMIQLADTMGWANPMSIRRLVGKVQDKWPDKKINLHLHDTRGLGLSNALAAMEMGVDDFDSAVAGLGGCPYAGFKDAPGNIATEDLVHLCQEIGVDTGVNLERLIEVAREAEGIVRHPLPGKVMRGGYLDSYRRQISASA